MSVGYHVYASTPAPPPGNVVNQVTPVATLTTTPGSGLPWTWTGSAIAPGDVITYLVRSFDTTSGLESQDITCFVTIQTDASGNDVATLPNAPISVTVTPTLGGLVTVEWTVAGIARAAWPASFGVYAGVGTPNYTTPVATVTARPYDGLIGSRYIATVSGLTAGTTYAIAVCGLTASSVKGPPSEVVSVTPKSSGPQAITGLMITTTSQVAR